jgi:hypothetical protein
VAVAVAVAVAVLVEVDVAISWARGAGSAQAVLKTNSKAKPIRNTRRFEGYMTTPEKKSIYYIV